MSFHVTIAALVADATYPNDCKSSFSTNFKSSWSSTPKVMNFPAKDLKDGSISSVAES